MFSPFRIFLSRVILPLFFHDLRRLSKIDTKYVAVLIVDLKKVFNRVNIKGNSENTKYARSSFSYLF